MYTENVKKIRKAAKARPARKSPSRPKAVDWPRLAERELKKVIQAAAALTAVKKLGPKPSKAWDASVTLIGSADMAQLNLMYRGKSGPTDVLSFSSPDVFRAQGHLGELVICLPVLKKQAKELKHTPQLELTVLLVHGLLHLLGLDHEAGRREAAEQSRLEQAILEKLGKKLSGATKSGPPLGLIQRAE